MKIGIKSVKELRNLVSRIISINYDKKPPINIYDNKTVDNLILFEDIFHLDTYLDINLHNIIENSKNVIKYHVFLDEMKNFLKQSPQKPDCDLTVRYCNMKLFHYMRERLIENKLHRFVKRPDRELLLERVATIVANSVQPENDIPYSSVEASLDTITFEVLNCLAEKYPNHPIFSIFGEKFFSWKNNNIDDNHWNEEESAKIMSTLDEYIFGKLNFRSSNSRDTNLKYMCIDYVLKNKCGHQIILLIIYHSVARRLGLRYDVISLQTRSLATPIYCIFWKPKLAVNSSERIKCFNINSKEFPECFDDQRMQFWRMHYDGGNILEITAAKLWQEMKEIIVDLVNRDYLVDIQISRESRLFGLISRKIRLYFKKTDPLRRSEEVKFAVGMVVTHNAQSVNNCAGVIIGWHRPTDTHITFSMSGPYVLHSSYICKQCIVPLNHLSNLHFVKQQTNYVILTEDDKICYVEEDALTLTPKWIDNSEVGRYFCKFKNTYYVPNERLRRLYPQDATVAARTTINI
ncbi:F-box only protein 21-like [Nylanderia fulva]|uniref:F-box only protein 21-like n=1 Tax=Nylanderia fulva TaxID=613905 RepID=UPI0010FAD6E6|nr:F-box only protein 21-like [Nylanderia fulva]